VEIVFAEFEDALALAKHPWQKRGRIEKIILYGSYARGGWVDEPYTAKGYRSDFDLLIIVNDKRLTDRVDYWLKLEDHLNRELAITKTLNTPINFIVHTLQEVNDGLAHGRYFFMDARRDGIALYQATDDELHEPKPKTQEQASTMAREYFDEWFPSTMVYLNTARDLTTLHRPKRRQGPTACPGRSIRADALEEIVGGYIEERLLAPEHLEPLLTAILDRRHGYARDREEHVAELKKRAAEAHQRLSRLYNAIEEGVAKPPTES
jgi:predicted nucleotidyltransferase